MDEAKALPEEKELKNQMSLKGVIYIFFYIGLVFNLLRRENNC